MGPLKNQDWTSNQPYLPEGFNNTWPIDHQDFACLQQLSEGVSHSIEEKSLSSVSELEHVPPENAKKSVVFETERESREFTRITTTGQNVPIFKKNGPVFKKNSSGFCFLVYAYIISCNIGNWILKKWEK